MDKRKCRKRRKTRSCLEIGFGADINRDKDEEKIFGLASLVNKKREIYAQEVGKNLIVGKPKMTSELGPTFFPRNGSRRELVIMTV